MLWTQFVITLVLFDTHLLAQAAQDGQQPGPKKIKIAIIGGANARNNIRQDLLNAPAVQITDENNKPIEGIAAVTFTVISSTNGPGVVFSNGMSVFSDVTNDKGQYVVQGAKANATTGEFRIRVDANYGAEHATAYITETNKWLILGLSAGKLIAIVAVVGGGAAGGAVALTRQPPTSPRSPSATIGVGSGPTIGPPH